METFTEMRNRLIEVHNWTRKVATLATRYYKGVDSVEQLREEDNWSFSELPWAATEIIKWR